MLFWIWSRLAQSVFTSQRQWLWWWLLLVRFNRAVISRIMPMLVEYAAPWQINSASWRHFPSVCLMNVFCVQGHLFDLWHYFPRCCRVSLNLLACHWICWQVFFFLSAWGIMAVRLWCYWLFWIFPNQSLSSRLRCPDLRSQQYICGRQQPYDTVLLFLLTDFKMI